jgi:DUF1365 family protein
MIGESEVQGDATLTLTFSTHGMVSLPDNEHQTFLLPATIRHDFKVLSSKQKSFFIRPERTKELPVHFRASDSRSGSVQV